MIPFWDPDSGVPGGVLYALTCMALLALIYRLFQG